MKKRFFLVTMFFILLSPVFTKVITMNGLMKPAMIMVKDNQMYILEKTTIFIHSLRDFKLIKKFGREGEGPREFMARTYGPPMSLSYASGQLVVNSNNKLSYFDKNGNFIRERKAFANLVLFQVKDNFVAIGPAIDTEKRFRICYRLFSSDLKEIKNLFHTNISVNPQDYIILPMTAIGHNPGYKDMLVIGASDTDFVIDIFDYTGKKIRRITKDFEKIEIPEKFKRDTHTWFKNESVYKQFYDSIKGFIKFKDYFPAIRDVLVADDTIHVITYKTKNNLWECILLDMKGNEKKRIFVPISRYMPFTYYPLLYSVENGIFYSLVEDEEEEVWQLHTVSLK